MKNSERIEVSERSTEKFLAAVAKYASKSVRKFHADILAADTMGGLLAVEELLKRMGVWAVVVDTYQQRKNRSFVVKGR